MDQNFGRDVLFLRMIGILTKANLDQLAAKTVAIPGAGGVGFTHAESLVRMGIGHIKIADFDEFSANNVGRQFGATIHTIGKSKVHVLAERLGSINPSLRIEIFDGVKKETIDQFLDGVDIVCDAMDYFTVEAHRLLLQEARKRGITVVMAGPVGFGATLLIFEPHQLSYDEYFDFHDGQDEGEKLENFQIGFNPGQLHRHSLDGPKLDFRNKDGSVLSSSCLLCSSLVANAALGRLLDKTVAPKSLPYVYQIDLAAVKFAEIHVPGGVRAVKADPEAYLR